MGMAIQSAGAGANYHVNNIALQQAALRTVDKDNDNDAQESAAAKVREAGAGTRFDRRA